MKGTNDSKERQYPAWRYVVFAAGNVLILFAALHGARMAFAYPDPPEVHWIGAMILSVVLNAIGLPLHIRRHGPLWRYWLFAPTRTPLRRWMRTRWHKRNTRGNPPGNNAPLLERG